MQVLSLGSYSNLINMSINISKVIDSIDRDIIDTMKTIVKKYKDLKDIKILIEKEENTIEKDIKDGKDISKEYKDVFSKTIESYYNEEVKEILDDINVHVSKLKELEEYREYARDIYKKIPKDKTESETKDDIDDKE